MGTIKQEHKIRKQPFGENGLENIVIEIKPQ